MTANFFGHLHGDFSRATISVVVKTITSAKQKFSSDIPMGQGQHYVLTWLVGAANLKS